MTTTDTTTDTNETTSAGIIEPITDPARPDQPGSHITAITPAASKQFSAGTRGRNAAARWLAARGYAPDGSRLADAGGEAPAPELVPTREAFLNKYRELVTAYHAGSDDCDGKVARVMAAARVTLTSTRSTWQHDGEIARKAYRAVGGKGPVTLKALRALPGDDDIAGAPDAPPPCLAIVMLDKPSDGGPGVITKTPATFQDWQATAPLDGSARDPRMLLRSNANRLPEGAHVVVAASAAGAVPVAAAAADAESPPAPAAAAEVAPDDGSGRMVARATELDASTPDPRPGFYYVTCRNSADQYAFIRGPWVNDHASALAAVSAVQREGERADPKAVWYAWGTARSETDRGPGVLGGPVGAGAPSSEKVVSYRHTFGDESPACLACGGEPGADVGESCPVSSAPTAKPATTRTTVTPIGDRLLWVTVGDAPDDAERPDVDGARNAAIPVLPDVPDPSPAAIEAELELVRAELAQQPEGAAIAAAGVDVLIAASNARLRAQALALAAQLDGITTLTDFAAIEAKMEGAIAPGATDAETRERASSALATPAIDLVSFTRMMRAPRFGRLGAIIALRDAADPVTREDVDAQRAALERALMARDAAWRLYAWLSADPEARDLLARRRADIEAAIGPMFIEPPAPAAPTTTDQSVRAI